MQPMTLDHLVSWLLGVKQTHGGDLPITDEDGAFFVSAYPDQCHRTDRPFIRLVRGEVQEEAPDG